MTERHPTANACQRSRRARHPRIDYYPGARALAIVRAKLGRYAPTNSYTGVLDAIVTEWAELTGIKYGEEKQPMTSAAPTGINSHIRARAYDLGAARQSGQSLGLLRTGGNKRADAWSVELGGIVMANPVGR